MKDCNGNEIEVGHAIKNIESGWKGQVIRAEVISGDLMLVCQGINWWTNTLDSDDTQWHAPADVVRVSHFQSTDAPHPLNFL